MKIKLAAAGKRFNREWIFRKADLEFNAGISYAITGANGSGKSTLLQSIGGMLQLSEGTISYSKNGNPLPAEKAYRAISYSAPYFDVVEEMTLREFLQFHNQFKNFISGFSIDTIIEAVDLGNAADKQIRLYSSGMKQRVRLAQAVFSDTSIVLLDEPCSNLDSKGIELYHSLIQQYCGDRLVIVCSNDELEYRFCQERIAMSSFKQA